MPPEAQALRWIRFAEDDLKASRSLTHDRLYHLVCFHAQQSAEKALKGYLAARELSIPREHHLVTLLHHCVQAKLSGRDLERACKILDQYYLPTRYPNAVVGSLPEGLPSRVHASEATRLAQRILRAVRRALSG